MYQDGVSNVLPYFSKTQKKEKVFVLIFFYKLCLGDAIHKLKDIASKICNYLLELEGLDKGRDV